MSTYAEKLKSPKWQKKRLEILSRDKFTCQKCKDTETTLHVHHKKYIKGKEPWDYPNEILTTLCDSCHELTHLNLSNIERLLISLLIHEWVQQDMAYTVRGFLKDIITFVKKRDNG